MKIIKYIAVILVACFSLSAMEPEIGFKLACVDAPFEFKLPNPDMLDAVYLAEKRKFEEYRFDNAKKFSAKLRTKLKKDEDVTAYLRKLQGFAGILLFQHRVMQCLLELFYIEDYIDYIKEAMRCKELHLELIEGETREDHTLFSHVKTPQATNAILRHKKYFDTEHKKILSKDELKDVIVPWLLSDNEELQKLALHFKLDHELEIADQMATKAGGLIFNFVFLEETMVRLALQQGYPLVEENTQFLEKYINLILKMTKHVDKEEKGLRPLSAFVNQQQANVKKYNALQPSYLKLYELIRQEMNDVLMEQITLHPNDRAFTEKIMQYTRVSPESKDLKGPLPKKLDMLVDPAKKVTLFSLDLEINELRPEVERTLLKKILKARRKKAKKTQASSITENQSCEILMEEKESPVKKIAEAEDGSYVLEGDDAEESITAFNPNNQTTEVIFKTDKPFSIKEDLKPNYTDWVFLWFKEPQRAISDQGYTKVGTKKFTEPSLYWRPIALHSFSQVFDQYIMQWGTKTTIPSRWEKGKLDTLITMPGMITFADGSYEMGVYAYIVNSSTGQWYHRMFEPQGTQKLITDLLEKGYFAPEMKGYYDVAFPPLSIKN